MTLESAERLVKHYKNLIANPDMAFPSNAKIKPEGREYVIEHAKQHLKDMEENIMLRQFIQDNPDKKLNPATVLKKLKVPTEAIEKEVFPEKEKSKKKK